MKNKIILKIAFISFVLFFTNTVFADTNINLQIKTNDSIIYEGDISVTPCDSEGDGVLKATPYCAIVQSDTASIWTGLWVDSIGGILNNDGDNGVYWMWLANLSIDNCPTCSYSLSGKQYELQNNDKILFYYNTNPLDIIIDKQNPKVGESIKINGKELGLDSSWNPIWSNSSIGKALINGLSHDLDTNGEFIYEVTNSDAFSVKIQKDGFIDSKELNINPEEVKQSHGSRGSYISNFVRQVVQEKTFSIEDAFKFLEDNQKVDGSFGSPLYTDWAAIAAGAGENQSIKEKLIKYYKENNLESNLVTDNERRAMALMSLGINPYSGTSVNYIKKITDSFNGTQFGDKTLVNDDIFALIVLKNAGYSVNDELITKDLNYIISKQGEDGSWGSIDMTAAGIQALKSFENITGVNDAILKSEKYITTNQKTDNGFENSSSTSWVLQTLSENKEILKGEAYLASKQDADGGMEGVETDLDTRIWATAYAIPAILHKPWSQILNNFSKPDLEISPRSDLGEEKVNEIKKIDKVTSRVINKKSVKVRSLEDKIKIENLIDNKVIPKSSSVWNIFKTPFNWLLVKFGF